MKSYAEAIDYLYSQLPMFTRDGHSAYKKDLYRTIALCRAAGNPQERIKTIHVAGTNGKGSSSNMLAAILTRAGYKTGLYTSPHLLDFRERIRVNGVMISKDFVVDFVNNQKEIVDDIQPSFFEATVAMAFSYFEQEKVDIAIIEAGLGGRLDSTNVISPILSLITNIGLDHMSILGDTIPAIASEKAGIIKAYTPVIISETNPSTENVFRNKAKQEQAPIVFADQVYSVKRIKADAKFQAIQVVAEGITNSYTLDLLGSYQVKNIGGVLAVVDQLRTIGFTITDEHIAFALANVQGLTGFQGRWQTLSTEPYIICDTGHNEDGIKEVVHNLSEIKYKQLHVILGVMKDKDFEHMLSYLPQQAIYYFASPKMPRAMEASALVSEAAKYNLKGLAFDSVDHALRNAIASYNVGDLIFVGGSNFVVSEVLEAKNDN